MNRLESLRVTEIFFSLQGETKTVGLPTVFIRLTGCPLRCQYCDTAYAFQGGQWKTFEAILADVSQYQASYVTVTGGEPLAQKACLKLLTLLCDRGYHVSLETSGALSIADVDTRVMRVVDIKTPGSLEVSKNDWSNFDHILPHDQIKFVICDRHDYEWSVDILKKYNLSAKCEVLFSPSADQISAGELAEWILKDQLPVRFQIQLHKFLWGNAKGR